MSVHYRTLLIAVLILNALAGCASELGAESSASAQPPRPTPHEQLAPAQPAVAHVQRGRYGLLSTEPTPEQQDPLQQIIELRLSPSLQSTVGDALHYVLLRSGYSLCAATPQVEPLFSRPLPSVHYQLGPITLHQAIEVLGGQAWQLQTDPVLRSVCFTRRTAELLHTQPVAEITP